MKNLRLSKSDDIKYDISNLQDLGISIYIDENNNYISKYIKLKKARYKVTLGKDNDKKYCLLLGYEYLESASEKECGCKDRKKCIFHLVHLKIFHKIFKLKAETFEKALNMFNKIGYDKQKVRIQTLSHSS